LAALRAEPFGRELWVERLIDHSSKFNANTIKSRAFLFLLFYFFAVIIFT